MNENQRYDLFACVPVKTTGIMMKSKLSTKDLDPQSINEIFCNYIIDCNISENAIEMMDNKIVIHLPAQGSYDEFPPFQPHNLEKYDLYDLLNRSEGGREELFYETVSEDLARKVKSYHKIEIKDEKQFDDTVEFVSFNMSQVS